MQDNQRQTHIAYIAGIMDADGCFMITRHKRKTKRSPRNFPTTVNKWSWTYLPAVKVSMVEREAIDLIEETFDGGTCTLYGARKSRPNSQPIWQWGIRKKSNLIPFLEEVIPHLRVKKNRAEFLLNYCKTSVAPKVGYFGLSDQELNYREDSYQKMRKFNGSKVAATTKSPGPEKACDSLIS